MDSKISFCDLSTEMKLFIFSFFNPYEFDKKVTKVCKQWRRLCTDPILWRQLIINGEEHNRQQIINVLNRNKFVRHISFLYVYDFDWLDDVIVHNSVRTIAFSFCQISKSMASRFVELFPRIERVSFTVMDELDLEVLLRITKWSMLKSFKLEFVRVHYKNLSQNLSTFIKRINHLEEIDLGFGLKMNDKAFEHLLKSHGRNLKYLNIDFWEISNDKYKLLPKLCGNITNLRLNKSNLMLDESLLMLKDLPSLEKLKIKSSETLFTSEFPSLSKDVKFPRVTELIIRNCSNFNDTCFEAFLNCFSRLTDLHIRGCVLITNEGLKTLPNICSNLELLNISKLERVTRDCVQLIASQLPNIRYCIFMRATMPQPGEKRDHRVVNNPTRRMVLKGY